jgi:hypothetical protein
MKYYTGNITKLEVFQIFVFGANTEGRHGKGAAQIAHKKFGAKYGQPRGLQGNCYSIVTKDLSKYNHPSIPKDSIISEINELYKFAKANDHMEFLVAYGGESINLNGYTSKEMAEMFTKAGDIPENMVFEVNFYHIIKNICN